MYITLAPPSVALHMHQYPTLASRDLSLVASPHHSRITTSNCSRCRTNFTSASCLHHLSWRIRLCEIESLGFRMSESRPHRKDSLGRRMSRKLSGWRADDKVDGKVDGKEDEKVDGKQSGKDVLENVEEHVSGPSQVTYGASKPEHLVILVNGIWGSVKNWIFAAKELKEKLGEKVVIHCSASNGGLKTHAGVDTMGHRLAKEVMEVIEKNPGVTKISFVGHSLGGLISRYAIGQLYAPPGERSLLQERVDASTLDSEASGSARDHIEAPLETTIAGLEKATIAGLEPINFITLATPHLGCRGNNHLPFLFGQSVLERAAPFISPFIIGRTGRHLFLADGNRDRLPLLERIVTDCDEGRFLSALGCFERRVAYANVCHDRMVGWRTASIRKASEMPEPLEEPEEAQKIRLKRYRYIVREEEVPLTDKNSSEPKDAPALDDIEEVMVAGLQRVSWHRVDVNFAKTDSLYEAHNLIQVKDQRSHSEGKYVIQHIIDNYF